MILLRPLLQRVVMEHYPTYKGEVTLDVKPERTDFEYSTPVAFALAKHLQRPPHEVAKELVTALQKEMGQEEPSEAMKVFTVDGAPPFINFQFQPAYWHEVLT